MREFLRKKLNKRGFTLAELLIVVAIIGVLVAVSIPIFSTQLEKSRENTDIANMRAAKAAAIAMYLDNNEIADTYYYDAEQGCLIRGNPAATMMGYGKGRTKNGGCEPFKMSTDATSVNYYQPNSEVRGGIIRVVITNDNTGTVNAQDTVTLSWIPGVDASFDTEYAGAALPTE